MGVKYHITGENMNEIVNKGIYADSWERILGENQKHFKTSELRDEQ